MAINGDHRIVPRKIAPWQIAPSKFPPGKLPPIKLPLAIFAPIYCNPEDCLQED